VAAQQVLELLDLCVVTISNSGQAGVDLPVLGAQGVDMAREILVEAQLGEQALLLAPRVRSSRAASSSTAVAAPAPSPSRATRRRAPVALMIATCSVDSRPIMVMARQPQ